MGALRRTLVAKSVIFVITATMSQHQHHLHQHRAALKFLDELIKKLYLIL